jgi:hypothetical protein
MDFKFFEQIDEKSLRELCSLNWYLGSILKAIDQAPHADFLQVFIRKELLNKLVIVVIFKFENIFT